MTGYLEVNFLEKTRVMKYVKVYFFGRPRMIEYLEVRYDSLTVLEVDARGA